MGYDPYDTLKSRIPFRRFGKWAPILAIQFQKRNPLNIRPWLGISKDYNPKAIGLLLQAYAFLSEFDDERDYSKQIEFLLDLLSRNISKGYSGPCWGYNFDWASPEMYLDAFTPSLVVTGFVGKGLFELYRLTGNELAAELLVESCQFILEDLPITYTDYGLCFSYTPIKQNCCYNANLVGAEILAKAFAITQDESYRDLARRALDFTVHHQHLDGHWKYNIHLHTGRERHQIDFHQGYVIESMMEIMCHAELQEDRYLDSLVKGADFYKSHQFFFNGRSKWRLPRVWPVDIHSQSQGIITLSKLGEIDCGYPYFAKTIANWTIENMQDPSGYFYYRKYRFLKNKIPYMRWAQAWMMLALSTLLIETLNSNTYENPLSESREPLFVSKSVGKFGR